MSGAGFNRKDIENQTKLNVAKYTLEGVSVEDRFAMISHFFQMYPESLQTVIYEVNPVLFSGIRTAENVYTHFYPYLDDQNIDKYIKTHANKKDYFTHKIIRSMRFDSRLLITVMKGYLGIDENVKKNRLDSIAIKQMLEKQGRTNIAMEKSKLEIFKNTMDLIRSHNSEALLVMMPIFHIKLETFDKDSYENLCKYLEEYASKEEKVEFINLNRDSLIYDARNFSDPLHYNSYGQKKINDIISDHLLKNNGPFS
ncbi:MAG: hypothetical protein JW973_17190 [Bacteroidales bacterium]|nr:hypothetical protein [Bacteroidales bacterium]